MRLITVQIDIDALPKGLSDVEHGLQQALALMRLAGVPLVDGITHNLMGEDHQHIGYWSISARKLGE